MTSTQKFLLFFLPLLLICINRSWNHIVLNNLQPDRTLIHADAEGYYIYLPALIVYQSLENIPTKSVWQFKKITSTNRYYIKYTYGVSLLQLPFFTIADVVSKYGSFPRDGYSRPYQMSIFFATLFYFLAGLLLLYKVLKQYFKKESIWLTILALIFGTNLMYYTFVESGMSHVYNFFLCAAMIYFTPRFYASPSWMNTLKMGWILGLLVFLRPTNIILALFFILYDISSFSDVQNRIRFFIQHLAKTFLLTLPFLILFSIQIAIWSYMWGELVFFSYNSEPGFIYWLKPKILSVWFHVWNGLFIYAPILLFSVVGMVYGIRQKQKNHWLILAIFLLSSYIFGSWWAWWFGGAYGARSFVDMLPLLAIPMAYFTSKIIAHKNLLLKICLGIVYYVLIFYSVRMTNKYKSPWDGPDWNWESWWEVVKTII